MWALLTVGQRHAIGQNSVVVLAQRLEWGADSRGELGEICGNSTATSEGAYGAQFWLNAGGKFQMLTGIFLL
jgi:hypothetical protein